MAGVEQFLGAQLDKQAKALSELVGQVTTMINAVDNSIEKFAVTSDNVQISKSYADEEMRLDSNDKYITLYVSGEVRIKAKVKEQTTSYSKYICIEKNGVLVESQEVVGTSYAEYIFDVPVDEKDIIKVYNSSSYFIHIGSIEVCYDEANKPGGVISD